MAEGALRSLLVEGVIGGVGSVLKFLPQILVLFFFIAILEDCGYMARTAYLMDRVMARVGSAAGRSYPCFHRSPARCRESWLRASSRTSVTG